MQNASNSDTSGNNDELSGVDKARLDKVLGILNANSVRFPVAEVVNRTGFNKGHVSSVLRGKIPMSTNFYETFLKRFGEAPKNEATKKDYMEKENLNTSEDVVHDFSTLAIANKEASIATRLLAESQKDLIQMLKASRFPNLDAPAKQRPDLLSQIGEVVEQMAKNGVGERWATVDEGVEFLDKLLASVDLEVQLKGTSRSVGTTGK